MLMKMVYDIIMKCSHILIIYEMHSEDSII